MADVTYFSRKIYGTEDYYPCEIAFEGDLVPVTGTSVIYGLVDPRNDAIFYIGRTVQFEKRMKAHCLVYPMSIKRSALDKRKLAIDGEGLCTNVIILGYPKSEAESDEMEYRAIKAHQSTLLNVKTRRLDIKDKYQ